ncbi:ATP-binding cassette sub-family A member 3-like [Spodoptera litura]|uniref:ATP-binding cassette sub-family A member 3-like n=1 Tax=Spodoptera litura TaxID=69820 RepID=A0A9J7DX96_SPOLT|nr:ATP-binding cassette sub-family A member 3-like [Spodoptera litura]
MAQDPRYFESPPANAEIGIKIVNVSKVYPKQRVLRNVSLEVYKGEITVLLGHNGAGKTTLMSIITGMTSATEGNVYVNGKDTLRQRDEVRQNLGLCPQHNLFFPDLSLREHIMFFTMLKRGTYSEARASSRALAGQLGLQHKLGAMCQQLSGGMQRRAQLACALAGGADVLILDEPTSGLDVETRRELERKK